MDSKTRGIYSISCQVNGKVYIGSSVWIEKRFQRHVQMLNKGIHFSKHLQNTWDCYGSESFTFDILEIIPEGDLIESEKRWIDDKDSCNREKGFNTNPNPGRPPMEGKKHSPETLKKLSAVSKKPWTPERLENHRKMLQANVGTGKYGNPNAKKTMQEYSMRNKGLLVAFDDTGWITMTFLTALDAKNEGYLDVGTAAQKGRKRYGFIWKYLKTDLHIDGF
jgi:group I intron endonuclease